MNENTLKRIENHYTNDIKDQRGTFVHVIESQLEKIQDENERNKFMLQVLPFIKQYCDKSEEESLPQHVNKHFNNFVNEHGIIQKGKLYRDFMKECMSIIIDDDDCDKIDLNDNGSAVSSMKCPECTQMSMAYIVNESTMTCMNCDYCFFYQDFSLTHFNNANTNNGEFVCQFAYKRINHFREWLTQIQGKENTLIPNDLIIKIMKELKKERIQNPQDITKDKIKKYLKKNGLSKYYEHIPIIINKICFNDKVVISAETEGTLISMFGQIQAPFERHRPKGRKNFLSYSYTLHKLCQLIGRHDLLQMFPLLKSRAKLYIQDETWEKICQDLNWKFIPSL